jgi:hypothetical protein
MRVRIGSCNDGVKDARVDRGVRFQRSHIFVWSLEVCSRLEP